MTKERYTASEIISTKEGFGRALVDAGERHPELLAIGTDITGSVGMNYFAEKYPQRFISIGIAEQNCVGVAVGLALEGKIPVMATYGVFAAHRPADQIRVSVCYNNLHVIIGGAHAGVSVGPDGATHQALEDIAALRAFPNITILSPCDANQTYRATIAAISQLSSPVYIRFGRAKVPNFTLPDNPFVIGKAQIMHEGNDACIIATGHMVWEALQAAYSLEHSGITCRVVNMSTIKPIDKDNIIDCAKKFPFIITVEEHQIIGGLGSAVAETTAAYAPVFVDRIGMRDVFGESGDPIELFEVFNMNTRAIINRVKKNLYHI